VEIRSNNALVTCAEEEVGQPLTTA